MDAETVQGGRKTGGCGNSEVNAAKAFQSKVEVEQLKTGG